MKTNERISIVRTAAIMSAAALAAPLSALAGNLPDLRSDAAGSASRAGLPGTSGELTLAEIIGSVINALLGLLGVLFLGLLIYAGFLWMTAQGNEDQVAKSRKILTAAVIGLAIVMGAYVISSYIIIAVTGATG